MKKYYSISVCGIGLLGLLAMPTRVGATPNGAKVTEASAQNLSGKVEISNDIVGKPETVHNSVSVAQTDNAAKGLSEPGKNLNASTAELVQENAKSPGLTLLKQNRQTNESKEVSPQAQPISSIQSALNPLDFNPVSKLTGSHTSDLDLIPDKIAGRSAVELKLHAPATSISQESNVQSNQPTATEEPAKLDRIQPKDRDTKVAQLTEIQPPDSPDLMDQVTNVSQLRDVQPSDWAYEALRSLVERYGCIAGYPDGTFRGNRAMTRYEFAAGLNACLQQVERLIASNTADFATKQDLATLQRLIEEFRPELETLRTRVASLEGRTAFLENHQFSTTTKLSGQAIMAAVGASGGSPDGKDGNIILVDRVRLNFQTSFTGKDTLIVGLQAYSFVGNPFGGNSLQNTLFPGSTLTEGMTKLSFEPQFAGFDPKNLSSVGANSVNLYKLLYIFPVAKRFTVFAAPAVEVSDAFPAITPFADDGQEALSRFAGYNPVVRVSGGTSGTGLASAGGFIWSISDQLDLRALYGSVNANIPGDSPDVLPGVSGTPLGSGLFGGSSVVSAQLTIKPTKALDIGLNYANSYHEINILGIGSAQSSANALGGLSLGTPVKLNSLGATLTWRFAPKVAFSAYGAYIFVKDSSGHVDATSDFASWMVGLHFNDLFKKGNGAGIIFGMPIYRVAAGGDASLDTPGVDRATPYHLEAYYRFNVTDNISITPGAFVLFNPEGDSRNETTTVGVLRTTFTF